MKINITLSDKELKEVALKQKKSIEEVANDYKHIIKDLEYSNKKLNEIIESSAYVRFPNNFSLHGYGKNNELNSKYLCYDNLDIFNKIPQTELAIVTGFGPTNSPTAGTLCSIFRVLELQKLTGIYTHIIIYELSALNSRQKPLNELIKNSHQFISFIKKLGFDEKNGEIRTHNNHDHSRVFSLVASVLSTSDLLEKMEVTNDTYKRLQLLGNDFSKMVSRTYTMTDIILPIIRDKKRGVIVPLGLEEHHHPHLAKIALNRMKLKIGGLDSLVRNDAEIGALHGKLISGFFPYVKMSKSIPDSSINLGDSEEELHKKIIECGKRNEEAVLQMMVLASDWNPNKLNEARSAFENLTKDYKLWKKIKYDYLRFFVKVKNLWEESRYDKEINTYEELFLYKGGLKK
jgi:tryptophanyl-tRNA synthetase